MGFYIQVPHHLGKAEQIRDLYGGEIVERPASYQEIPEGKGLVVVVLVGPWDAAGFCYNEDEFLAFTDTRDTRPKRYVLLDRVKAAHLSGYTHWEETMREVQES